MAETYCGKTCSACEQKEFQNCSGCKTGPGRQYGGDCEIAECVRSKGHETCDTCGFQGNCGTFRGRAHQSEYRQKKQETELWRQQAIASRASVLGKWLWLLFWLIVPSTIADLMASDTFAEANPGIYMAGQILSALCSLAYGILLLKASSQEGRYRTAGFCALAVGGINGAAAVIPGGVAVLSSSLILTVPLAIIGLVGEYNEYFAHAIVLSGIDIDLSGKWDALWKWHFCLYIGMICCTFLMATAPFLGSIALIAAAIGIAVVRIVKLVYLYKTAKTFRECESE